MFDVKVIESNNRNTDSMDIGEVRGGRKRKRKRKRKVEREGGGAIP
jgi:hypothetical protein